MKLSQYHKVRTHIVVAALICFCILYSKGQTVGLDTVQTQSQIMKHYDTLRVQTIPIPLLGSLDRTLDSRRVFTDTAVNFSEYKYAGDLLSTMPGVFIRDLGSPGQLHGLTIKGEDARGIAFMADGILLNEPMTGVMNTNLISTENIEDMEVVSGTQAFLYGLNSTGGAINVIGKSKKALHPYSRIRYSESAHDYGYIDGLVSQDIIRGLNVTTGFQHVTLGGGFKNSEYDAWNARLKVRYNISNTLNLLASENYNQTQLGLNGGIDTSTPPDVRFDLIQAAVRNTDSYEKITRHDVELGAAAKLFPDSDAVTSLTFYHSTNLREYRDEENRPGANGIYVKQDHRSQWSGARLLQYLALNNQRFSFGGEAQSRGVIASPATGQHIETAINVFGKDDVKFFDRVDVSMYGRLDHYLGQSPLSYGSDVVITPAEWLQMFGGYSKSFRFPTFQELYWHDSVVSSLISGQSPERHHLFEAGIRLSPHQTASLEALFFHRTIFDAIDILPTRHSYPFPTFEFVRQDKIILQGCTVTTKIHVGSFYLEGAVQYLEQTNNKGTQSLLPKWSGTGGIYFWDRIVANHLDLKAGIRGRVIGPYRGTEYNPLGLAYVSSSQPDLDATGTSDFVLIAHLGSAYIHFIWENLPDRQYVIVPYYPMPDRQIRFGISWEFTD